MKTEFPLYPKSTELRLQGDTGFGHANGRGFSLSSILNDSEDFFF